jgi:hypothetical protein
MSLLDDRETKIIIAPSLSPDLTGHPELLSAMTSRILHALPALATLTLFSCYPYPEPPPQHQRPGRDETISDVEQQKIKDQRDRMKDAQDRDQQARTDNAPTDPSTTPKPPERKPANVPTAQPVPGKEGFVFSPFNNKVIDVRDMPSGTLVADPTYPASEKKHFRVP